MDYKEAAAQASVIRDALNAHLWTWGLEPTEDQKEMARSGFLRLAQAMGYRVERIGDGVNTGRPVVAGGV